MSNVEQTPAQIKEHLIARAKEDLFPWVKKLLPETVDGKRILKITIESDEQLRNCSDLLALAKSLKKDLNNTRSEEKKPSLEEGRRIDAGYKQPLEQAEYAIGLLAPAIIIYSEKKEQERLQLLALQYAEQQKAIAEQQETGEVVPIEAKIIEESKHPMRGNMSITGIRTKMEFTVQNESLVPPHLKTTDLKKVESEYDIYQKPIPGILITEKKSTVSRFS